MNHRPLEKTHRQPTEKEIPHAARPVGPDAHSPNRAYPETAPEPLYELRILQAIRRIIRAIDVSSRKTLAEYQVSGPQLQCLRILSEHGPLTLKALAQRAYLSSSTLVGIIDRLRDKGLVERQRSLADRRRISISVTESGRRLAQNAPLPTQERLVRGLRRHPELERVAIALSLERLADLIETDADDHLDPQNGAS